MANGKRDENGKMLNSVTHTRTRINEQDPSQSIDQEALVKDALRYDPDIIAPGEIRGREAFETMGAANTGHTVITTVHSNNTLSTPERIITLAKKAYDMSDATFYSMAARAFPILVHCEKLHDETLRALVQKQYELPEKIPQRQYKVITHETVLRRLKQLQKVAVINCVPIGMDTLEHTICLP